MIAFKDLKVKSKLALLVGIFSLGFIGFGAFLYGTLNLVKVNGPVYADIVQGKDLIADILPPPEYLIESYLVVLQMTHETQRAKLDELVQRGDKLKAEYEDRHQFWVKTLPEGVAKETLNVKSYTPAKEFFEVRDKAFIPALLQGEREKANQIMTGVLKPKYEEHRAAIDAVVSLTTASNAQNEQKAAELISRRTRMLFALGAGILGLVFAFSWLIARGILNPLRQITPVVEAMVVGNIDQHIAYQAADEIGQLAGAFRRMTETLRGLMGETASLIQAAQAGKLDARGNTRQFQGVYAGLVTGLNEIMGATETLTNEVQREKDAAASFLHAAGAVLDQVAARDLTARMSGDYDGNYVKIKHALNTATENLEETLAQVVSGAEQVTAASHQINDGSQGLAQSASSQASSLEEISSSLQEMSAMTKQTSANSQEARTLAAHANQATEGGLHSMQRLSESIAKIKASSDATAKIVKTIDEIAFQTNLLALNAAVEAARAGDAGKGFAVVADEVRRLAMRSAEAAKHTADLIEESVKNAEGGVEINQEVLKHLAQINERIKKVSGVMDDIAAASEQQAQGIEQVNLAVEQMNSVVQQIAADAEGTASAAGELTGQAEQMLVMASQFTLSQAALTAQGGRSEGRSTSAARQFAVWGDQYLVGHPDIDSQHQRLFDLINELHQAMTQGSGNSVVGQALTELYDYTHSHFSMEEGFMQKQRYPDYASHKAQHDGFRERILKAQSELQSGKCTITIEILSFLKKWLVNHIQQRDTALVAYLGGRGPASQMMVAPAKLTSFDDDRLARRY